jgi:hypothetical protein
MVDVPASKEAHEKTRPLAVMDKSNQLLAYYSFQRKSVK